MEQYNMKANFRPAAEPKNGHVGFADLTIANAIHIRDISVFENQNGDGYHVDFPGFGEDGSYVVPSSKEAYAQMVSVISAAVKDEEKHFGWQSGKQDPFFEVSGHTVNEPHADARFSVKVADICTLYGIATHVAKYTKEDNTPGTFVSVDMPKGQPYEKDGEKVYPPLIEALKNGTVYKDGKEEHKDFEALLNNLVRAERKKEMEKKPSLADQIAKADQKAAAAPAKDAPGKEAPAKEAEPDR